ncbi:MAG: type II toxin-antitoxin system RelB/DinJ family antitoxin [Atopobiaceae bacterium]|nr:type II toxin-antitoxin system RelB/DinJ family antitoxin [Atopobiaceae bacterium]
MSSLVQLNTRIDPDLKRRGDLVFERAGLSSSEVVRAVWAHAAHTQEVPSCIATVDSTERAQRIQSIHNGAGVARRVAQELGARFVEQAVDYESLRDEHYDALLDELGFSHV